MKSGKIHILIVDDHPIVIKGFTSYCRQHPKIDIVASASGYRSAVTATAKYKPDIILLDIFLGERNGLDFLDEILLISPRSGVIIYTAHIHRSYFHRAMKLGAKGYALKCDSLEKITAAIQSVHEGSLYISSNLPGDFLKSLIHLSTNKIHELDNLTPREQEIAGFLAQGKSVQVIADVLCISPKTVRVHRGNIMKKLTCNTVYKLFLRLQEHFPNPYQ
ncbi:response regulator [Desulfopila inferna]|uniref:response regulator n=1 Tax=Desulfopila inferna TaxID=468528 RepID=UPI0019662DD1|nr:response regulator transcription factor [Desulfopila inferna]MBM9606031.1 response regulator transcription factor [Desulfopila inferna]